MVPLTPRALPTWGDALRDGEWWAPGRPDLRFAGSLDVHRVRGPRLTFESPAIGQEFYELSGVPTVFGELASGEKVTLWDLRSHHLAHLDSPADRDVSLHRRDFTYAILGEHLDNYATTTFRYSAVRFHDLHQWSRMTEPVPHGTPLLELADHPEAVLESPYAEMLEENYRVVVTIEHPQRVETSDRFPHGALIEYPGEDARMVFEVAPSATAGFHDLLLRDGQAMLTFAYQQGAPVAGEWLFVEDPALPLAVMRPDSFRGNAPVHQGDFQMLITPEVVGVAALVEAWWAAVEDLFPAPQVITTYLHSSKGVLEQSTASAIAATENFHERIGPTLTRFEPAFLEERLDEILANYAGDEHKTFRGFLREKFKENRPTLGTRLSELRAAIGEEPLQRLGLEWDVWVPRLKKVRNALAHTGAHVPRRGVDTADELDRVNEETRAVLCLLILRELGLDDEGINRAAGVLARAL